MAALIQRLKDRLLSLRKAMGWSQAQLAEFSGISLRHIQDIEAAKADIKLSTLNKLGDTFHLDPVQMLCWSSADGSTPPNNHISNHLNEEAKKLLYTSYCPLDELPIGIQICDSKGLIRYCNVKCAKFHGYANYEVAGKKYIWDFLSSENEKTGLKKYLEHLVLEQPHPTPYITKNLTKTGELVPLRVHWNYIHDSSKNVIAFFSMLYADE